MRTSANKKHKGITHHRWGFLFLTLCLFAFELVPALFCEETLRKTSEQQIERGRPIWILDALGNLLSIPQKILLLNAKVDNHRISPQTEQTLKKFLDTYPDKLGDVKVRLNQWTPVGDMKRLTTNHRIEWYFRIFPGIPITLFSSLTGRLLGGDHYNPYTNTIHLFSDDPAIALHEAGHAKDFAESAEPGLYAVGRILPPITLHQEQAASETAIEYLEEKKDRKGELHAYSTLYPAFGTYGGEYFGLPYGNYIGAAAGHILGFRERNERALGYKALDEARVGGSMKKDELSQSLINDRERSRNLFFQALRKNK